MPYLILQQDLLNEIYKNFNLYNMSPSLFSEKELMETIILYKNLVRFKGVKTISWPRNLDSFTFEKIDVIYIPCGIIKY